MLEVGKAIGIKCFARLRGVDCRGLKVSFGFVGLLMITVNSGGNRAHFLSGFQERPDLSLDRQSRDS
ncbi:MAG: hypothetical protein OXC57_08290 [Rhodobacteraceae bacterium]|nr:hypothetical protein [Paracoccaceae bacterium]